MDTKTVYTIGYGNRHIDDFIALLEHYEISAICDVRSQPYSTRYPQFSRAPLSDKLRANKIRYVFLGKELGARPSDPRMYDGGRASYAAIAASQLFVDGLERVKKGLQSYSLALMCAEKDPLDCHRAILISPSITSLGLIVKHIGASGQLETQSELEARLLKKVGLHQGTLFAAETASSLIDDAYKIRGDELAYDIEAANKVRQPR